jgi:serine protease Do
VTRAWLGVAIQDVTPELAKSFGLSESHGALVADVTPRSPADKAGIERGDIIVTFNGTGIADSHALPALAAQQPVGDRVSVTVLRRGVEKTVAVILGQLTAQQANAERGRDTDEAWGFAVANSPHRYGVAFSSRATSKVLWLRTSLPTAPLTVAVWNPEM